MSKLNHVDAVFGGKSVRFALGRSTRAVQWLELMIGSPMKLFQSFAAGDWKVSQLRTVLQLAHPDAKMLSCPEIDRVLAENAPGIYVPLVAKILESFLFGLPPELASFDERQPFPEPVAA